MKLYKEGRTAASLGAPVACRTIEDRRNTLKGIGLYSGMRHLIAVLALVFITAPAYALSLKDFNARPAADRGPACRRCGLRARRAAFKRVATRPPVNRFYSSSLLSPPLARSSPMARMNRVLNSKASRCSMSIFCRQASMLFTSVPNGALGIDVMCELIQVRSFFAEFGSQRGSRERALPKRGS
jgi:hypothetical protein